MQPLQICIGPIIRIGRESWCLPYAGFFRYRPNNQARDPASFPLPDAPARGQWLCSQDAASVSGVKLGGDIQQEQHQLREDENAGLYMNIRGLYPRNNKTKVAYLSDLATESKAPFLAITESHLSADVLSAEI